MIKLIASDMDGTLLTGNTGVSAENKQAIKMAQEKGIEFIIATGRSYPEAQLALNEAEIECPVICVNGAEVRAKDGSIISSHPLAKEKAKLAANSLHKYDVYFEIYTNKGTFTTDFEKALAVMLDVFTSANHGFSKVEVEEIAKERMKYGLIQLVTDYENIFVDNSYEIYKLLAFSKNIDKLSLARNELEQISKMVISSSGAGNLEITSIDAQKGIALEEFAKKNGFTLLETMAIGDNDNDLSMLKRVGRSVAMGNAANYIKEQCDYVTATNDEHGVAKAIFEALQS